MCQALLEIMEPEISEIREYEMRKGKIIGTVETLREVGQSDDEIIRKLIKNTICLWSKSKSICKG